MLEDPTIIRMNIDRYREMLTQALDADTRARVGQLLAKANRDLALAANSANRDGHGGQVWQPAGEGPAH